MSAQTSQFRPAGPLPAYPLAAYSGPWDVRLAAHLLRRAGFGGGPQDVQRLASMPVHDAVDSLIHFPSTDGLPAQPAGLADADALQQQLYDRAMADRAGGGNMMSQMMNAVRQKGAGDPELVEMRKELRRTERIDIIGMQGWWLDRMIATPAPLQEKMTLFWHGHFTTAAIQKGVTPREAFAQNSLFRENALGNIRDLTQKVAMDPAMLKYLDNIRSERQHPNENFARELMELYTLGIGNYSEADVRESARAWTGIRVQRGTDTAFVNPRLHDDGVKTFLGKTGNFAGSDIVNIIFEQPACAQFFATKLIEYFVYDDPEPELVDAVATMVRKYDYNLTPIVSTLLRSNVFFSPRAYRSLVKSPVEFVVGSYQLFGIKQSSKEALGALNRMGQILFYPPNVKGWPGGSYWLNSSTVLARENFANSLMTSKDTMGGSNWLLAIGVQKPETTADAILAAVVQGDASPASRLKLAGYLGGEDTSALGGLSGENFEQRLRGGAYLAMAMPAYQLA